MKRSLAHVFIVLPAVALLASPVAAQSTAAGGAFAGSVPNGTVSAEPLPLTLAGALERGLKFNLGIISLEEQVESARGARIRSLRALMPRVDARLDESRQTRNLAAFGFNSSALGLPGGLEFPSVVGPFNVFDARVYASQPILDLAARNDLRSSTASVSAAQLDAQNARDVVTLVVTNLYFQAVAAANRIETAKSQVATAEALLTLATNQRNAGVTPGIDVVRAQVQLQAQKQRLIAAENDFEKLKVQLARAIGVPVAQRLDLADRDVSFSVPALSPALSVEEAVQRATENRPDYQAIQERVHAAESALKAVQAEALPTVQVNGDYGTIGSAPSNAARTYSISGTVRLSLFDTGRKGRELEDVARLKQRQAEAADYAERIDAEVRTAFLDVQANEQQLAVARERVALARQELSLAQTRFSAGVTSNLEVIQAQNGLSAATDNEIAATYAFNVAKASLARAIGTAKP